MVLEITGNGGGLNLALDAIAEFGRVALLGCTRNSDFSIDYYRKVHGRGVTLIGAHTRARPAVESSAGWWTERDDAMAIIKLLKFKRVDFDILIEDILSPKNAGEIYSKLACEKSFPLVQFDWNNLM